MASLPVIDFAITNAEHVGSMSLILAASSSMTTVA